MKGNVPWNRGLTKDTDERVRLEAKSLSETRKRKLLIGEIVVWNKGLSGDPKSPNYDPRLDWMMGDNNPSRRPEVKKKLSEYMQKNNPMHNPEHVERMQAGLRKLYDSGYKNKNTGTHPTEETRKNMVKGQQRRKENNPEEKLASCRKGGLTMQQKYPNMSREHMLRLHEKNDYSEIAKRTNREWKARDPEGYRAKKLEYARLMVEASERKKRDNPEEYYASRRKAGKKAFKTIVAGQPYVWQNVHFMSNLEMECAKLILTKPIDGVNCNVNVSGKIIDFYPQEDDLMFQGKFVEYHPWDRRQTLEEYEEKRKQVIENSEYKGTELIVITNLEVIKNGNKEEE